jgi:hypothetical protein
MKKFTIPCDFGGKKAPFGLYVGECDEERHPLHFQQLWLFRDRGGHIPQEVMDSFAKLQKIALENNVSFEELCMYALGQAAEEKLKETETQEKEVVQEDKIQEELSPPPPPPLPKVVNYSFKSFKTYSDISYLPDNKKKYRDVFVGTETAYLYFEFCFVNLLYLREEWNTDFELKAFRILGENESKEVCTLKKEGFLVKPDQHIIHLREGWGNIDKTFWKQGFYIAEAFLDGKSVAVKRFYVSNFQNPYQGFKSIAKVDNLNFYEGPYDDVPRNERQYSTSFEGSATRYVYFDLVLTNYWREYGWNCELVVKIFDKVYDLKGVIFKRIYVVAEDEQTFFSGGWGAQNPGTWKPGEYLMKVFIFEEEVASGKFTVY